MIEDFLRFLGTNEIILGIATLLGIIGFIMTLIVSLRTANISKILKHNQITNSYNKERIAFQKSFEGHKKSIIEDNIKTFKIQKDILTQLEEYRTKYSSLHSISDKRMISRFIKILEKENSDVDWNTVTNYLAKLSGRLSKKEDKKNG